MANQIVKYHSYLNISLRDIEKIAITIALLRTVRGGSLMEGAETITTAIAVLYVLNRELLNRIYQNHAVEDEIDNFFKFRMNPKDNEYHKVRLHLFCLAFKGYSPSDDPNAKLISQNRSALHSKLIASLLSIAI